MCGSNIYNPLIAEDTAQTLENTIEYLDSLANTAAAIGTELAFIIGLKTAISAIESVSDPVGSHSEDRAMMLSEEGVLSLSVVN